MEFMKDGAWLLTSLKGSFHPKRISLVCFVVLTLMIPGRVGFGQDAPSSTGRSAVPVKAVKVVLKNVAQALSGMGSLECAQTLDVGLEVTGLITEILVDEGDAVTQNQVVAELDNRVIDAEIVVNNAEIKAADAEANFYAMEYKKRQQLFDEKAVSDTELKKAYYEAEKAAAKLETLKARRTALQVQRQQRILRAPISGIVGKRYVENGAVVTPLRHKILQLIQCKEAVAVIQLGESHYRAVRPGQPVVVKVDALGGREYRARVTRIRPVVDMKSRMFTIEATIKNDDLALAAGMFVRADILVTPSRPSAWLPKSALLSSEGSDNSVYVVIDGVAVTRDVKIRGTRGDTVRVVAGLKDGEIIIVEGKENASNLAEVDVTLVQGQD